VDQMALAAADAAFKYRDGQLAEYIVEAIRKRDEGKVRGMRLIIAKEKDYVYKLGVEGTAAEQVHEIAHLVEDIVSGDAKAVMTHQYFEKLLEGKVQYVSALEEVISRLGVRVRANFQYGGKDHAVISIGWSMGLAARDI